eukprot:4043437-Pyramimonas_sp.AAC.1
MALGPEGSQLLARLGELLHGWRLPYVLGGDWNCTPQALRECGWESRLRATICSPSLPTCRCGQ